MPPRAYIRQRRVPLAAREVLIIRRLQKVIKLPVTKIALAVNRNKTTVYEALDKNWTAEKKGRPDLLTTKQINLLVGTTKDMIKKAAGKKEVTLAMIMKRAKIQAGERCARKALHSRNIRFRRMRSKPILTKEDVQERYNFAVRYRNKPKIWWLTKIDIHQDMKNFQVYGNEKSRAYAAQREVRGHYRAPGDGLGEGYVVAPKHLKYNTGARSARIAGGVGKGRMILWYETGKKWNGQVAADFYKGPVLSGLKRAYPRKRSFLMLEDNDPTGYKSTLAVKAKRAAKIRVFKIPKRSPDLSVMDYAIWKQITRTMRRQEMKFKKGKKETRAEFLARLNRVAKSLPANFIKKAIGNMRERCQRLYAAKGFHFEEGGKSKTSV
jgi:hypothetical protein